MRVRIEAGKFHARAEIRVAELRALVTDYHHHHNSHIVISFCFAKSTGLVLF